MASPAWLDPFRSGEFTPLHDEDPVRRLREDAGGGAPDPVFMTGQRLRPVGLDLVGTVQVRVFAPLSPVPQRGCPDSRLASHRHMPTTNQAVGPR